MLESSQEMERLLGSCFGRLFRLPVKRHAFSVKLVDGFLTRKVVIKKKFELWHVLGGEPPGSMYMCTSEYMFRI